MAALIPFIFAQFSDNNGAPLAAGSLTFYAAGTSNLLNTSSDAGGSALNQNPLTLDSGGRSGPVFLGSQPYDIVLKDALGNTVATMVGITGANGVDGSLTFADNIHDLRALAPGVTTYAFIGGIYDKGDGGSRLYYYDAASTATDDNVTVLEPVAASGAGRWLLLLQNGDSAGFFTVTSATDFSVSKQGVVQYVKKGKMVTLSLPPLFGTSTSTTMVFTGVPAALWPTSDTGLSPLPVIEDSGSFYTGAVFVSLTGTLVFSIKKTLTADLSNTGFTASGTKGLVSSAATRFFVHYLIDGAPWA